MSFWIEFFGFVVCGVEEVNVDVFLSRFVNGWVVFVLGVYVFVGLVFDVEVLEEGCFDEEFYVYEVGVVLVEDGVGVVCVDDGFGEEGFEEKDDG